MPSVVIQPAADRSSRIHFQDTIERPVPLARVEQHVSPEDREALRAIYGSRGAPTWGATPAKDGSNVAAWNKLGAGDLVLFMRDKHVFATGVVTYKLRSGSLARDLWSVKPDGQAFEYAFFLDDVRRCEVPYDVVRAAAGYSSAWNPLGFTVVTDHRADAIASAVLGHAEGAHVRGGAADTGGDTFALVRSVGDLRRAVLRFNAEAGAEVAPLLTQTSYWVYDPQVDAFAPSKYAGIRDISLDAYARAQALVQERGSVPGFDGHRSRTAIERAVGREFSQVPDLSAALVAWGESVAGPAVFAGADPAKWRFVSLEAGPSAPSKRPPAGGAADLQSALQAALAASHEAPPPLADTLDDARKRVAAEIVRRQGQPKFRRMLLAAYGGRCAISGCDAVQALEAAHIRPYRGSSANHPTNGLPLRADLHTLFDLGLITIDPAALTVIVSPHLRTTQYGVYQGRKITLPSSEILYPSREALREHRARSGL